LFHSRRRIHRATYRQRYVGRDALSELSGGDDPPAMSMTWHHLVFDADRGIGAGEYTFTIAGTRTYHGVTMVQVRNGLVSRWREYQYRNDMDWADFVADSRFEPTAGPGLDQPMHHPPTKEAKLAEREAICGAFLNDLCAGSSVRRGLPCRQRSRPLTRAIVLSTQVGLGISR
jgi:hypothetical protein